MKYPKFRFKYNIDYEKETIEIQSLVDEYSGKIIKEILNTKDEIVREALIKLGWRPPK